MLYCPHLNANLISIGRLCDDGYTGVFRKHDAVILDKNNNVAMGFDRDPLSDRLWHPKFPKLSSALLVTESSDVARLWHQRLGHLHPDGVISFLKENFKLHLRSSDFPACEPCMLSKLHQSPATSSFHRSPGALDLVHTNILGPISPPTPSGY